MARWRRLLAHSRQATTFWRKRDCLLCPCSIPTAVRRLPSNTVVSHLQSKVDFVTKEKHVLGVVTPNDIISTKACIWMVPEVSRLHRRCSSGETR